MVCDFALYYSTEIDIYLRASIALYNKVGTAKQIPYFCNTIKALLTSTVGCIFINILIIAAITALEVDELCKEMLITDSA